jgi:hypothetical protein
MSEVRRGKVSNVGRWENDEVQRRESVKVRRSGGARVSGQEEAWGSAIAGERWTWLENGLVGA